MEVRAYLRREILKFKISSGSLIWSIPGLSFTLDKIPHQDTRAKDLRNFPRDYQGKYLHVHQVCTYLGIDVLARVMYFRG